MSMWSTNDKTTAAVESTATNKEIPTHAVSPLRSLTFKAVIYDVASWWCYAILKHGDLKLFDELDGVLESLSGPLPASSPLSIRLRCLVPWHELLKQLYTPGCSVGEKKFETIQDKLLLLHQGFFSHTPAMEEFKEVLRMVQTHSVLSNLYSYFSKIDDTHDGQEFATNKKLDQCNAEWESIYLESDSVPPSLLDLVDKNNGWDFEDRRDHILQIVSFPDSALTYKRLKKKMQSLLLRWFEHEIVDSDQTVSNVPELLRKRYRGIGYGGEETIREDSTKATEASSNTVANSKRSAHRLREDTSIVLTSPIAPNHQPQDRYYQRQKPLGFRNKKSRRITKKSVGQRRQELVSQNKRKANSLEQDQASSVLDSSYRVDWSDSDSEEEPMRSELDCERQNRFRKFSHEHRLSTGQRMEQLLSMPVGEPSYSEASPRRKKAGVRKRRLLADRLPDQKTLKASLNDELVFSTESTNTRSSSSSSSSDFNDSDEEITQWTLEEDEALKNGIKWNGYGNWALILKEQNRSLGSKDEEELRARANQLLANR